MTEIVCIHQTRRVEFWDRDGDQHRYGWIPVSVPPHGYGQRGKFDIPTEVTDRAGKPRCRWCFGPVKPPKRTWCGQACLDEYWTRAAWDFIRKRIIERDRVCQFCGGNGTSVRPVYGLLGPERMALSHPSDDPMWENLAREDRPRETRIRYRTEWEVDHILAVADGGTDDPINLRLLCVPCHKLRTKLWHQQRAERNHGQLSFLEPAAP